MMEQWTSEEIVRHRENWATYAVDHPQMDEFNYTIMERELSLFDTLETAWQERDAALERAEATDKDRDAWVARVKAEEKQALTAIVEADRLRHNTHLWRARALVPALEEMDLNDEGYVLICAHGQTPIIAIGDDIDTATPVSAEIADELIKGGYISPILGVYDPSARRYLISKDGKRELEAMRARIAGGDSEETTYDTT